ncbi:transposase [candidate division WWE3 bacterium]|uniref:Transposase n=1 Tax=candidate division WWE3 bacterium TaxID=2053526 RepID=A0A955LL20_UNCKA|nr:transposase [candidate division WWE3 bacterium]
MSTHSQLIKHVFNRGVRKTDIFLDDNDRKRFVNLMRWYLKIDYPYSSYITRIKQAKTQGVEPKDVYDSILNQNALVMPPVKILAWVLMCNHFHLLLCENTDLGIARYIHRISSAYAAYFNRRHNYSGRLFESSYKSIVVEDENQLLYVIRYIHKNPVEVGLLDANSMDHYSWSSWLKYSYKINDGVTDSELTEKLLGDLRIVTNSTSKNDNDESPDNEFLLLE